MRTRNTFISLAFSLSLVTACAHSDAELSAALDPWIGKNPDQLVEKWGSPSSTYQMENGVKVLTYANDRVVSRSIGYGYRLWRHDNFSYTETCKINFFTDAARKKIEKYTTLGGAYNCLDQLNEQGIPKPS